MQTQKPKQNKKKPAVLDVAELTLQPETPVAEVKKRGRKRSEIKVNMPTGQFTSLIFVTINPLLSAACAVSRLNELLKGGKVKQVGKVERSTKGRKCFLFESVNE